MERKKRRGVVEEGSSREGEKGRKEQQKMEEREEGVRERGGRGEGGGEKEDRGLTQCSDLQYHEIRLLILANLF